MAFSEQKSEEELIKLRQAQDSKSEYKNLNSTDRQMLKAFFSYIDTTGFRKAKKKKTSATAYVQGLLWPERNSDSDNIEKRQNEDDTFDLQSFLENGLVTSEIPCFLNHNIESMKDLFQQGENFDCGEEQSFLKTFKVKKDEGVMIFKRRGQKMEVFKRIFIYIYIYAREKNKQGEVEN